MKRIKIDDKTVKLDIAQIEVFNSLENLRLQLHNNSINPPLLSKIKKFFLPPSPTIVNNLYIYGKVGRGKSMLMRFFFNALGVEDKFYCHFNSFMQDLHKELHILRKSKFKSNKSSNLIFLATKNIVKQSKVVCFDEMQVEDIADAMIIRDVFRFFFQNNITVVTTSNCYPLELYQNGLQRDAFLDFVKEVMVKNFKILNLDNKIDYREQFIMSEKHYFYPNNTQNEKEILGIIKIATNQEGLEQKEIEVLGSRKLLIKNSYKNIALFQFDELCEKELGVPDFKAICREFGVVFLLNIPKLSKEDRNEAKRLILFIDEAYESNAQLVIMADTIPEEIYVDGVGSKAFKRAASRLNEIIAKTNK